MRRPAWLLAIVFVIVSVGAAWAEAPEIKKVTGKVSFVCPKHKAIKVKSGDKEQVLLVFEKCPKKDKLIEQIAKLEVGRKITASYFQCPKSKKLYLTKIEVPKAEG